MYVYGSYPDLIIKLVIKLNSDLAHVRNWLIENKLQVHPIKSNLIFIGSLYNLNNNNTEQPVVVNNFPVSRTDTHKCLGIQLDEKLSWDSHVDMICKKASAGIGAMRRIKPYVPIDTLEKVYKSLVQPYFEYCSPLWDNCGQLLKDKPQRSQSRAARVLTGANYDIRSADIIQTLSWDTLDVRRLRAKSTLTHKILNRELKQPRRRRQQKPHKFAYLTMENSIFARFARAYFIF